MLPLLKSDKVTSRTFYWRIERADRKQRAVRHGDWKYVRDSGIELLFDLSKDIGERKDLAYQQPATRQEFLDLVTAPPLNLL